MKDMQVTGVPKNGKRIQLFEGLTIQLPGGAVYYTDAEERFCISMPTSPARAGLSELPDDAESRWSIKNLDEYASIDFAADDGAAQLSDYHNLAKDSIETMVKNMAETMSSQLGGLAQYEARLGAEDENRIVGYVCAKNQWLEDRYYAGYFLIGIPHYPEKVMLYMGYYDAMDGPVFEKEFLPLLNSAQSGGQGEDVQFKEKKDGGLGSFAGANGKLDAMKALSLFQNDVFFFNEGEIRWDGNRHTIAGIQFNAEKANENRTLMKRAQAVVDGLGDLASYLEDNPKLRVPASQLHSRMREFLHGEDVTGMMFFHLAAWHLFWLMTPDQVATDAAGSDMVLLDTNFPKAVPGCRELIEELLRSLRAYNGITEKRNIVFHTLRNLDGTEPFNGDLLENETTLNASGSARSTAGSAVPKPTTKLSKPAVSKPAATPAPRSGAAAEQSARAGAIKGVLSAVPMTVAEINAALGTDYTPLQTANACKLIPGVSTTKVIRTVTNAKGATANREYTAFYIDRKTTPLPSAKSAASAKPVAPSKPVPAPNQEDEQAKYQKAVKSMKVAVEKKIEQTKREVMDQKAEVERLQRERTAAEQKLNSLGFFKFAEKTAAKEEIARCEKAVTDAKQKLSTIQAERMRKVRQVLDQHPLPAPPAVSRSSSGKKGASADTTEKMRQIQSILTLTPMTVSEINYALGTDYTALQIANACKFIPANTVKVYRVETDKQGEPTLKEYTAYYI